METLSLDYVYAIKHKFYKGYLDESGDPYEINSIEDIEDIQTYEDYEDANIAFIDLLELEIHESDDIEIVKLSIILREYKTNDKECCLDEN